MMWVGCPRAENQGPLLHRASSASFFIVFFSSFRPPWHREFLRSVAISGELAARRTLWGGMISALQLQLDQYWYGSELATKLPGIDNSRQDSFVSQSISVFWTVLCLIVKTWVSSSNGMAINPFISIHSILLIMRNFMNNYFSVKNLGFSDFDHPPDIGWMGWSGMGWMNRLQSLFFPGTQPPTWDPPAPEDSWRKTMGNY